MIYTSRFQNPELKSGNYTVVGIVRGVPRFRLGYERAGNIIDIAPTRELFNVNDRAIFTPLYMKHLDEVGFEKISAQIYRYESFGKDVVLCCYEDVRIPGEWCHRLVFAEWWENKTGQAVSELKDDSPVKVKTSGAATGASVKFVLPKVSVGKAYLFRDGSEKEIDFKEALRLIKIGAASIQDILTD